MLVELLLGEGTNFIDSDVLDNSRQKSSAVSIKIPTVAKNSGVIVQ